ncbi:YeiH family protein [Streptococcus ovuberis]|uniref:YeiH family putative sulfate export transporter n=1 Tax=Streptococcus ovuberis TaxID=1936207 RepID=A0A7X6MYW4_9STRE|nr:YeiH family protein [Streptococcus ovuberis]NKZ20303.1 YeiH family putative sulfate export transporter [Streptococcus ovuberis]
MIYLRGLALCFLVALPAWFLGQVFPLVGAPVIAMLLGMSIGSIHKQRQLTQAGITFTAKVILQLAVVLLGFSLNLHQVLAVGLASLPVIVTTILTALAVAFLFKTLFNVDATKATLIGVGSSICGGSAIAATAPVIDAEEAEVAQAISVIFFFNLLAALLFPSLGQFLGLSNEGFALFAGTAVNDTSSVTATASAWDSLHQSYILEQATIVKLTRTLAIIPITLSLSFYRNRQKGKVKSRVQLKRIMPTFLLYFLAAALFVTLWSRLGLDVKVFQPLKTLSKFLIVMAMAAIGFNTHFGKLLKTGGRAFGLGATCWLAIIVVTLAMQSLLGMW